MKILANAHTHTNFCDGQNSAEAMVQAALAAGFHDLGFSGHSYCPFDPAASMSPQQTEAYIAEINHLKEKYYRQINIHLGIELDYYSQIDLTPYQYTIGSVHYLQDQNSGHYYAIDNTSQELEACIKEMFHGQALAMVEHYFNLVVETAQKPYTTILGHFDLVRKLNKNSYFFAESSPSYKKIALAALRRAVQGNCIFEINSGAMCRGYTDSPYPADFLLYELAKLQAPITLSSDAHTAESLDYAFTEITSRLPAYGFKEIMVLNADGFSRQKLY